MTPAVEETTNGAPRALRAGGADRYVPNSTSVLAGDDLDAYVADRWPVP